MYEITSNVEGGSKWNTPCSFGMADLVARLSSLSREFLISFRIVVDEANMQEDGIAGLVSIFLISHHDAVRPQTIARMKYV
jgi:hypothetical protein